MHLAHEIRHAEVDPTLPEGMSLAYDGLVLGSGEAPAGDEATAREGAGSGRFDEG